jgi:fructoselysine-6-P-deglycase FrlB-like protein
MNRPPAFDPTAPLPGPPDPWAGSERPALRDGPPYLMTEMIEAEPHLARRLLGRLLEPESAAARLAGAVGVALANDESVILTGCGTSEHAAMGAAEILRAAAGAAGLGVGDRSIVTAQAFELALEPPRGGLVVGVSHEGGTWATNRALAAAGEHGARTALITVSARSPGAALASPGLVVETDELDQAWCHTVGYLSPLLAAAAVGAHLAEATLDAGAAAERVAAGLDAAAVTAADAMAGGLADARTVLTVGSGADRPAARELALKIEEGAWLPAAMRDLETVLHGHLAATDGATGLVLFLAESRSRAERVDRARGLLRACRAIGIRAGLVATAAAADEIDSGLTPLGRIVVAEAEELPAPVAALLGTATPLQLLTERLARARGINPDPIHRDHPAHLDAAEAVEGA